MGLTRDGNVGLRDLRRVPLAQRAQVNALIAQSNQDRAALYREIAIAPTDAPNGKRYTTTLSRNAGSTVALGLVFQNAGGASVQAVMRNRP